jgi:hypothetical protein
MRRQHYSLDLGSPVFGFSLVKQSSSSSNMKLWFVLLVALGLLVASAQQVYAAPRLLKINSHASDYNNQKHVTGMYRRTQSTTNDLILRTGRPFVVSLTFSEPLANRANLVPLFRMRQVQCVVCRVCS